MQKKVYQPERECEKLDVGLISNYSVKRYRRAERSVKRVYNQEIVLNREGYNLVRKVK